MVILWADIVLEVRHEGQWEVGQGGRLTILDDCDAQWWLKMRIVRIEIMVDDDCWRGWLMGTKIEDDGVADYYFNLGMGRDGQEKQN